MRKMILLLAGLLVIGGCMTTKAQNNDYVAVTDEFVASAWVEADEEQSWTYSSADSPSFVASVNADMTATISPGMRVRLTQTTVKYFIVTAVGSYSGGVTELTMYGGTDYTLADAAIESPAWSSAKAPFGFPMDLDKWAVEVVDPSQRTQSSPSAGTWYNIGTTNSQITLPIGVWNVSYKTQGSSQISGVSQLDFWVTLSTADNSESNTHMTAVYENSSTSIGLIQSFTLSADDVIAVASETVYYLNAKTSVSATQIAFGGSIPTIIRAVCAYL